MDEIVIGVVILTFIYGNYKLISKTYSKSDFILDKKEFNKSEFQIGLVNNARSSYSEVPKNTKFGTYLGQVVLTNKRLIFLSRGNSGVLRFFTDTFLGGKLDYKLIMYIIDKNSKKSTTDFTESNTEGSASIQFGSIKNFEVKVRKYGFLGKMSYLYIEFINNRKITQICIYSEKQRSRYSAVEQLEEQMRFALRSSSVCVSESSSA